MFWGLSDDDKVCFLKQNRKRNFLLPKNRISTKVCKKFFLDTLSIDNNRLQKWLKQKSSCQNCESDSSFQNSSSDSFDSVSSPQPFDQQQSISPNISLASLDLNNIVIRTSSNQEISISRKIIKQLPSPQPTHHSTAKTIIHLIRVPSSTLVQDIKMFQPEVAIQTPQITSSVTPIIDDIDEFFRDMNEVIQEDLGCKNFDFIHSDPKEVEAVLKLFPSSIARKSETFHSPKLSPQSEDYKTSYCHLNDHTYASIPSPILNPSS
jgi:hypothetical protein